MLALGTSSINRQEGPVAGAGIQGREARGRLHSSFTLPSVAYRQRLLSLREKGQAWDTGESPNKSCSYEHPLTITRQGETPPRSDGEPRDRLGSQLFPIGTGPAPYS